jgi:hypothetical protein
MTSEEFIRENPTIAASKVINILKAHGYAFTAEEGAEKRMSLWVASKGISISHFFTEGTTR